jgi:hypothetical protein
VPERTRLQRLFKTYQDWCDLLLSDPTFFTVIDSYPIELLFPFAKGAVDNRLGKGPRQGHGGRHQRRGRDLRLCPPDGRRDGSEG